MACSAEALSGNTIIHLISEISLNQKDSSDDKASDVLSVIKYVYPFEDRP
jgi:hypothetical protein